MLAPTCEVDDRASVEARFGLSRCTAHHSGRRCDVAVGRWSLDRNGTPRPGVLATALDHVLGESLATHRPHGWWTATSELTIDFLAPFDRHCRLQAIADPIQVEYGGGYAQARLIDEQGSVVAAGSTWVQHLPPRAGAVRPVMRPPSRLVSLAATVEDHLRFECLPSSADSVLLTLRASASWSNVFGLLHGGVWTCLAEVAAAQLLGAQNPTLSTARLHVAFVRAARGDGPVTLTARARHVGSSFAVVEVLGRSADDMLCTISTVTARSRTDAVDGLPAAERNPFDSPTRGRT